MRSLSARSRRVRSLRRLPLSAICWPAFRGAAAATAGIFLPAFFFAAVSGPLVPRFRRSPLASVLLDGLNAASFGLMAVVTLYLAQTALADPKALGFAAVGAFLVFKYRWKTTWLIVASCAAGMLLHAADA